MATVMLFELWWSRVEAKDQLTLLDILETLLQLLSKCPLDTAPPGRVQQLSGSRVL